VPYRWRAAHRPFTLLYRMCQLVRQQMLPRSATRIVFARVKIDVVPMCEGLRAKALVHRCRRAVVVDPHLAEVAAERGFHLFSRLIRHGRTTSFRFLKAAFDRSRRRLGGGAVGFFHELVVFHASRTLAPDWYFFIRRLGIAFEYRFLAQFPLGHFFLLLLFLLFLLLAMRTFFLHGRCHFCYRSFRFTSRSFQSRFCHPLHRGFRSLPHSRLAHPLHNSVGHRIGLFFIDIIRMPHHQFSLHRRCASSFGPRPVGLSVASPNARRRARPPVEKIHGR